MPTTFDAGSAWGLHERVALRHESFGALAYHFGTRRLSFVKHPDLVRVIEQLDEHDAAEAAISAVGVQPGSRKAFVDALGVLASTGMIVPRDGGQA